MERRSNILLELDRRRSRQLVRHGALAIASVALIIASALAVRYELNHAELDGAIGVMVRGFELVFIVGIVPLTVTALLSTWASVSTLLWMRRQSTRLPSAVAGRPNR